MIFLYVLSYFFFFLGTYLFFVFLGKHHLLCHAYYCSIPLEAWLYTFLYFISIYFILLFIFDLCILSSPRKEHVVSHLVFTKRVNFFKNSIHLIIKIHDGWMNTIVLCAMLRIWIILSIGVFIISFRIVSITVSIWV